MKLLLGLIIILGFASCNRSDRDNSLGSIMPSEKSEIPLNHQLVNRILVDSLSSFDEKLKIAYRNNYIITVEFEKESISDGVIVSLSQILNKSEINGVFPSYVAYIGNTPIFIFTGFEELINMPQSYMDLVNNICKEKLIDDVGEDENSFPPTTYTPLIDKFVIYP